jgi:hypothetical protein
MSEIAPILFGVAAVIAACAGFVRSIKPSKKTLFR